MFRGVLVATVTPFREGRVDLSALGTIVERLIASGVHGLVPLGSTGEATTLDLEERRAVLSTVVEVARGRVPVLAGAGTSSTRTTVQLCVQARECGADGVLVVTPPYNRPTPAGLLSHFTAVASEGALPVVLYNVPSRTGVSLDAKTVAELARREGIVGIKEASADMGLAAEIATSCPPGFDLLSGDDVTALPFWSVGGVGVVSVVANVAPRAVVEMWEAFQRGDLPEARAIHHALLPLHRALFVETNPVPVKAALARLGFCTGEVRPPLAPLLPASSGVVEAALAACWHLLLH